MAWENTKQKQKTSIYPTTRVKSRPPRSISPSCRANRKMGRIRQLRAVSHFDPAFFSLFCGSAKSIAPVVTRSLNPADGGTILYYRPCTARVTRAGTRSIPSRQA